MSKADIAKPNDLDIKKALSNIDLKNLDIKKIGYEISKFTRKVNTLGKAVDFITEDLVEILFTDKYIEDAYKEMKKQLDFFMRHLT